VKAVQVASDAEIYFQREQVGETCGEKWRFWTFEGFFYVPTLSEVWHLLPHNKKMLDTEG